MPRHQPYIIIMLLSLFFSVCLSQVLFSSAADLPPPIKTCKNDKSINDCILKQVPAVFKAALKGYPKYGVPALNPLHIGRIEQTDKRSKNVALNLTMEDIYIHGIDKAQITKVDLQTSKKFLNLVIRLPQVKLFFHYIVSGKFLVVPITGDGNGTVVIDDMEVDYTYRYNLVKRKGVEYVTSDPSSDLKYTAKKMFFNLENLFNGNKALGDSTNKMINDNWEEFNKEVGKGVGQAMGEVFSLIIDKVAGKTPYNELFS